MELPKKFNEKCFIYNKTGYQAMNYKKKKKRLLKLMSLRLITSYIKCYK